MIPAGKPPNEAERLRALREAEVLDTPPEQVFDDVTRLAAYICGVPIALVSLVDEARQWFKSRVGLDATETPRELAFCAHAILGSELFVVQDAQADERFADNPLVTGAPHVTFYAGAPIRTQDGLHLGTVCVIDHVPRDLTPAQRSALAGLSRMAAAHLDLRRSARALARANEEIAASREHLADFLDGAHDLIQSVTPEGQITYVNRAWKETLGYSDEDLKSLRIFEIIAPESQQHCMLAFQRLLGGEQIGRVEVTFLAKDGRRVHVEGSATCRRQGGVAVSTRGIFRDVTEQRAAIAQKRGFIVAAAAEMRSPLTAIRGSLAALQDVDLQPDARREVLDVAIDNTSRLLRQVQDVIDLARLESGQTRTRRSGVAVADLLVAALPKVEKRAHARAVTITAEETPALHVRGDQEQIVQVVINLLSAAVRLAAPGRAVLIRVAAVGADRARFSFESGGAGIAAEDLPHVFDAPHQVTPGAQRPGSGGGFGLAVAKAIVEANGGTIGASSKLGYGAKLWFELPLDDGAPMSAG